MDIDSHYKGYSPSTRLSLEAWSGSKLDLGMVCFFVFFQVKELSYSIFQFCVKFGPIGNIYHTSVIINIKLPDICQGL